MPSVTADDDQEVLEQDEAVSDVWMTAVFQKSRLGVAWYDSEHGEVRPGSDWVLKSPHYLPRMHAGLLTRPKSLSAAYTASACVHK